MLISMNWISDFVDLTGLDKMALIRQFSLSTAEVENEIFHKGADLSGVVAAQIVSVENHPESHKLHLLKVDAGDGQLTDVVCGAPNVQLGMKTAFAKVGAQLGDITISPRKLAGYTSYGMCCSEKEIGISDDNSGIMVIPEDVPCGTDLKALYPIDDIIFEVDNKSLTNRPDLWGHYGMAREFSTLSGRPLKALPVADLAAYNNLPAIDMKIEDPLCQRYSCLRVENINRHVSPMAMRIRLNYCGMRDINFLADLTNYLMLEMGQPMHAFDSRKVEKIRIRRFPESFPFQTLDKVERTIDPNTLMICNGDKPVAIAGIMGGLDSEIVDDTTSLTLESATFDAASVRKSSVRLAHRTDASARYEKSLDPEMTTVAIARFVKLLKEYDPEILRALGLPEAMFPKLTAPGTVLGPLKADIAAEVGGQTKVVLCATHDTASAVEGIPMEQGDAPFLSSGTWSLLGVKLATPITSPESRRANFTNEGGVGYIRYLKNIMGLWIIQCLQKQLGISFAQMVELAKTSTYTRIFDVNAARFSAPQDMRAEIRAALAETGEAPATDADLINSVYHSLAYCYGEAFRELETLTGQHWDKLYIAGGGAKNATLNELTAHYTGKQVVALPIEATAIGNLKIQMSIPEGGIL